MSIRYELDTSGPLHKIVKVVDAPPPAAPALEPNIDLSAVVANLLAGGRRRRGWGFGSAGQPVRTPDPARTLPAGDLLRARKAAGLSQRQLAAAWRLSRGLVAEVERGHRSCPLELAAWARRKNAGEAQP